MKFSLKLNLALFIVTIYLVSCTKQVDLMNSETAQIANAARDANLQTARMTQDGSLADSYIIVYKDDVTNIDDMWFMPVTSQLFCNLDQFNYTLLHFNID